ncbi:2OG-Fe dioxygenase family protein [Streptomyces albidus (ex Kaewkla and Franco 2022)]|uniref:2OG-Fe dioxygenase family protein n=1 Tax=Streptomyces albidus (ex Kaewkla and Franco 2022) TaxID=722709 RepID=UPI0015EEC6DC|nr:2OG-Fe dioxygenase family protein [Streptomyces albidus (ex Kaewkla and Franco 2022)]
MPLTDQRFSVIDIPAVQPNVLDSYDNCPLDEYMGNGTRYKRFSQYRMSFTESAGWGFELLPHRDYTTFKKFNNVAGGVRRGYLPIEVDFTPLIRTGAEGFPLDTTEEWQINVHQNRTRATGEKPGPLTPEGVHHDGHEFVMIAVLRRNNVAGGLTRLWKPGAEEPFWDGTLEAGQAVLLDDRALAHDVTDVLSADGGPGYRDILIVAFSRWSEKWYGDQHDEAALNDAPEPSAM